MPVLVRTKVRDWFEFEKQRQPAGADGKLHRGESRHGELPLRCPVRNYASGLPYGGCFTEWCAAQMSSIPEGTSTGGQKLALIKGCLPVAVALCWFAEGDQTRRRADDLR